MERKKAILEYAFVTVGLTFLEFYSRNLDVLLSSDCHENVLNQNKKAVAFQTVFKELLAGIPFK